MIKDLISIEYKMKLSYILSKKTNKYISIKDKKKIIVALAADYGNLGDVAITLSQEDWLKNNFPQYDIIDFPISKTISDLKSLTAVVNEDDIITIVGGGNMNDLYWDIEVCRQLIIKAFPNNKIISFPQSIFFKDKKKFNKTIKIYNSHKNITLIAREKFSYEFMKKYFKNVLLNPDIVFSLNIENYIDKNIKRENIGLIIRNDKESLLSNEKRDELIYYFKNKKCIQFDTLIDNQLMDITTRKEELSKLLNNIISCRVVITNRLHGMIFCAITQTPCIVLPINNNKIIGVYDWIKDLNYIKYLEEYNIDLIEKEIQNLKDIILEFPK